ncbi:hypothetical protein ACFQ69_36700 [Streptomyces sp. NPDC056470]|uniref:hypothetical protein n=1 Tax=Streptomyces sp. NPDC056470 TaxID=3345831 RepID=UPI00367F1197
MEIKILLQEVLQRLPGLHMDRDKPLHRYDGIVHSVIEAHFKFDQKRAEEIMRSTSTHPPQG